MISQFQPGQAWFLPLLIRAGIRSTGQRSTGIYSTGQRSLKPAEHAFHVLGQPRIGYASHPHQRAAPLLLQCPCAVLIETILLFNVMGQQLRGPEYFFLHAVLFFRYAARVFFHKLPDKQTARGPDCPWKPQVAAQHQLCQFPGRGHEIRYYVMGAGDIPFISISFNANNGPSGCFCCQKGLRLI